MGEIAVSTADTKAVALAVNEQGLRSAAQQPVSFSDKVSQTFDDGRMEWDDPYAPQLTSANGEDTLVKIYVVAVEVQGFTDAEAGRRNEPEQR